MKRGRNDFLLSDKSFVCHSSRYFKRTSYVMSFVEKKSKGNTDLSDQSISQETNLNFGAMSCNIRINVHFNFCSVSASAVTRRSEERQTGFWFFAQLYFTAKKAARFKLPTSPLRGELRVNPSTAVAQDCFWNTHYNF